jgi:hypothetical protein
LIRINADLTDGPLLMNPEALAQRVVALGFLAHATMNLTIPNAVLPH